MDFLAYLLIREGKCHLGKVLFVVFTHVHIPVTENMEVLNGDLQRKERNVSIAKFQMLTKVPHGSVPGWWWTGVNLP